MWWVAHAPAQGRGKGGVASAACRYGRAVFVHQGEDRFGCSILPGRERLMSASCWAVLKELEEMRTECYKEERHCHGLREEGGIEKSHFHCGNWWVWKTFIFLLIPQFFLVGSGEAFIYTGQLDFVITQSPKGMKTMGTGLFLSTLSLGFIVSSFLVSVVKRMTGSRDGQGWLADNINYKRLDC
ncbi:hypothetical protein AAG906_023633 [Vitis piasezkii]